MYISVVIHLLTNTFYGQVLLCLQHPYSLHHVEQHLATHQQCHQSTGLVPPISSLTYEPPYQAMMPGPTVTYYHSCTVHIYL